MPVVPITPAGGRTQPKRRPTLADLRPPPSEPFALMAAAQMHADGHLLPDSPLPPQLGGKEP